VKNEETIVIPLHKPDWKEQLFFFVSGLLVSVPFTLFFAQLSDSLCVMLPMLYAQICSVAIFTPFIEEFAKIFPLFYRHGETERSIVSLGLLVGLGFGVTEFALYVFTLDESVIARLPGIIFHASSTTIAAYGIAKKNPVPFYLVAVALHFTNNFFALLGTFWSIAGPAVLLTTYFLAWYLYRRTSETIVV
jgi:RsiW-degrading membrane proteinase PrsW (M82 family)